MEEIQPFWKVLKEENRIKIKDILYRNYDLNKNFKKQVLNNIEIARKEWISIWKKN